MSTIDPAMKAMLETFIHETDTMLEQLDEILLDSEKAKNINNDNINDIFRITHTIKGSAAMMGFDSISGLAHALEDVFYVLREHPDKLDLVFDSLFDLILESSDFLKAENESLLDVDNYDEEDSSFLIEALHNLTATLKNDGVAPASETTTASTVGTTLKNVATDDGSGDISTVKIFFENDIQMENMRAFMLINQLKPLCTYLESIPANPETNPDSSAEIIKSGLLINFKPIINVDDVLTSIETALNIKSYELIERDESTEEDVSKNSDAAPAVSTKMPTVAKEATSKKASSKSSSKTSAKQSLISVNQIKLDHLMDLVGELVTAESMVVRNPDLEGLKLDNFTKSIRELRKLTDELQDIVMSIRMVPLQGTFHKMDRIVRDMSKKLNKPVEFITEGGSTEVDKTINDAIVDPLMHMIRNSMDHAIETVEKRVSLGKPEKGTISLSAKNVGGEIHIIIADDGSGLDTEVLLNKAKAKNLLTKPESDYTDKEIYNLILLPGFSTNTEITEFSGRGVGMDVVRKNIEQIGGTISISSVPNQGTNFTIKIPLTLAIMDGMNISVGETIFTLPITSITQSFKIYNTDDVILGTDNEELLMIRGECYPLYRLHELFDIKTNRTNIKDGIVIKVECANTSACIFVDELLGEYQVVVKPFPSFFNKYDLKEKGFSGCSILGDGTISLILDVNSLLN